MALTKEQGDLAVKILTDFSSDPKRCDVDTFHELQPIIHELIKATGAEWPYKD